MIYTVIRQLQTEGIPEVCEALNMAIQQRRPAPGLIVHSDRGSQYASELYQDLLTRHGFVCSMSRKGNCWDNAVAERCDTDRLVLV